MVLKKIFVINGSASENSANQKLIDNFIQITKNYFTPLLADSLRTLPHFSPELSNENTPKSILNFRAAVQEAAAVLICTPEYVFSIPSGLKNAIEWCVSTTVFSDKPLGIITASANGEKGHEELQLIMKTVVAKFSVETTLLIPGVKGKVDEEGKITHAKTEQDLIRFAEALRMLTEEHHA